MPAYIAILTTNTPAIMVTLHTTPYLSWQSAAKNGSQTSTFSPQIIDKDISGSTHHTIETFVQKSNGSHLIDNDWLQLKTSNIQPYRASPTTNCSQLLVPPPAIDLDVLLENVWQFCCQNGERSISANKPHPLPAHNPINNVCQTLIPPDSINLVKPCILLSQTISMEPNHDHCSDNDFTPMMTVMTMHLHDNDI